MSEEKINNAFLSLKLSKYEPPVFKETKEGDLILYGKTANDLYPDYLIGLYEKSTNHKAVIDAKHRFTFGGGWHVDVDVMSKDDQALYLNKSRNINKEGESLNDLTAKLGYDYYITRAFAIEVIFNETRTKWVSLNYVPVSQVRALRTEGGKIKYVFLTNWKGIKSYDQAKSKEKELGMREWYAFGSQEKHGESELFYYRDPRPIKSGESDVYAIPSYMGAIPWIELDIRTGVFHLNNIKNNFTMGTVINFNNGDPTPEAKKQILDDLKKHYSGDNAEETGGIMAIFNKPGSTAPNIERMLAGDQDKLYLTVARFAREGILTAHNMPQSIAGIPHESVVFDKNTIATDFEYYNSTYITPIRVGVFERTINYLMQFNGLQPLFRLKPVSVFQNTAVSDKYAKVLQALSAMPPLLADKIVESIGKNDLLAMVGLEAQPTVTTTTTQNFSKDENMEVFFSFDVPVDEDGNSPYTDEDFKSMHFKEVLGINLTGSDGDILSMIAKDATLLPEAIATALKKSAEYVADRISKFIETGILKGQPGNLKITKVAEGAIQEEDLKLDIQIRYFYEGPLDERTRGWCRHVLENQPKDGYTLLQIQSLKPSDSNYDGNNFNNRGGFWTHKDGTTTTFCRHKWRAKSVRFK